MIVSDPVEAMELSCGFKATGAIFELELFADCFILNVSAWRDFLCNRIVRSYKHMLSSSQGRKGERRKERRDEGRKKEGRMERRK